MIFNADITLYNRYVDPTTRREKYQRSTVSGVVWQDATAVSGWKEQTRQDTALIMIPYALGTNYVKPIAWQALVTKTGKWTLQEADVVVRGTVTDEITEAVTVDHVTTPAFTMTDLRAKYDDVVTITNIAAMLEGSALSQHWEIDAK